jgi:hypothetical protein
VSTPYLRILPEDSSLTGHLTGRMAWIMVSTGVLKQIGEDQVAHTRLSRVYVGHHPSGVLFQIMLVSLASRLTSFMGKAT